MNLARPVALRLSPFALLRPRRVTKPQRHARLLSISCSTNRRGQGLVPCHSQRTPDGGNRTWRTAIFSPATLRWTRCLEHVIDLLCDEGHPICCHSVVPFPTLLVALFRHHSINLRQQKGMEPPDWRVSAGPRRQAHSNGEKSTKQHMQNSVIWFAHCMMGRGRTHHRVAKQKNDDHARRPTIPIDYLLRTNSHANPQTIPQEQVTQNCSEDTRTSDHHEQRFAEERH